jgi:adenosylmethionine-8-amino-7-oxononanoate aminotransferase
MSEQFDPERLEDLARRHLWVYFAKLSSTAAAPIIVRGEGCHVYDAKGKRYFDGLAGLFLTNVGHGRKELGDAAERQMSQLHYFPLWTYTHPPAIELATKLASMAPGDLNRVFFTTGGGDAVETAWKLAKQYFRATGQPDRHKIISRRLAYHGTTMGALAITGVEEMKTPYAPATPGTFHARHTGAYRAEAKGEALAKLCADDIERIIIEQGPETVAAVILEPVQNSGGCFPPPPGYFSRVREICDRHGALLISDEVICAFGRLGQMFACDRYDYMPDIITCAKGITSGYAPVGAAIISDRLAEPFIDSDEIFLHGMTYGGHPVGTAIALANIGILEREDLPGRVRQYEGEFLEQLRSLEDLPIVGDIRGAGYFYGIELVKDKETQEHFSKEECTRLLHDFLSHRLFDLGLICRAEDKGDPVIQLAPPLIAGPEEFAEIVGVLRQALSEAWKFLR